MKQVFIRKGRAVTEDVPAPGTEPGTLLVRVSRSCISVGTEMKGLSGSGSPIWKRALTHPQNLVKVAKMVTTQGIRQTRSVVQRKLSGASPTGYSAMGKVMEIGEGIDDLRVGDRVSCAGAEHAHHAEIIRVPRNLVVPVPAEVDDNAASTVTLGAIALQGVRRAQPTLGETFVVLGLGILGQLTSQILKANGCRVIGFDLNAKRMEKALSLGMDLAVAPDEGDPIGKTLMLTNGIGADGVIITAAGSSDEIVSTAFQICRRKARVILVGDVGLSLNRADFYEKEIDFFISSSYGPGRYDSRYEDDGLDYPIGYVRWTENRNMAEYLRQLAIKRIDVEPLIEAVYPAEDAERAYADLEDEQNRPLMVLLSYETELPPRRQISNPAVIPKVEGRIRLAVVGAGEFARSTHLPNIVELSDVFSLTSVVGRSGHSAAEAAREFGAASASTDLQETLAKGDVDAVLIATRHHLHAEMVLQCLQAGKHVFVEKPLALNAEELEAICRFYQDDGGNRPMLLTGYNRRHSRFARRIYELTRPRVNPMILNYQMNAGRLPADHWVHGSQGGGRNIGEACHVYDLFTYLVSAPVTSVFAQSIRPTTDYFCRNDNFTTTVAFEDGSFGNLTYTALGSSKYPKEKLQVFVDGTVIVLDDFKSVSVNGESETPKAQPADKGHRDELTAFADAIRNTGRDWPIPLWQQVQASRISFAVESMLGHNGVTASATDMK